MDVDTGEMRGARSRCGEIAHLDGEDEDDGPRECDLIDEIEARGDMHAHSRLRAVIRQRHGNGSDACDDGDDEKVVRPLGRREERDRLGGVESLRHEALVALVEGVTDCKEEEEDFDRIKRWHRREAFEVVCGDGGGEDIGVKDHKDRVGDDTCRVLDHRHVIEAKLEDTKRHPPQTDRLTARRRVLGRGRIRHAQVARSFEQPSEVRRLSHHHPRGLAGECMLHLLGGIAAVAAGVGALLARVLALAAEVALHLGGRCGEMWGDVGRCGEMWGEEGSETQRERRRDLTRCEEI